MFLRATNEAKSIERCVFLPGMPFLCLYFQFRLQTRVKYDFLCHGAVDFDVWFMNESFWSQIFSINRMIMFAKVHLVQSTKYILNISLFQTQHWLFLQKKCNRAVIYRPFSDTFVFCFFLVILVLDSLSSYSFSLLIIQ